MEATKETRSAAVELLSSLGMVADRDKMRRQYMDLMRFTSMDGEAPFFSEGYLYEAIGKEDARSVMAYLHAFAEAAGIPRNEQHELECLADRTQACEFCWGDGYCEHEEDVCNVCEGKGWRDLPAQTERVST